MVVAKGVKPGVRAFIVGYTVTGQIGRNLIEELAASETFSGVKLLGRREVDDFKTLKFDLTLPSSHNTWLTSNSAKAGVEGFKCVDFDYVLASAETA
jgi:hypothetical protein